MLNAGDIVEIKDVDHMRILDRISEDQDSARAAFFLASEMVVSADKRLWGFLHETNPDTIGRSARYISDEHSIEIMAVQKPLIK